VLPTR
jgi:hypothetical protein